jgi:hypothetical protein
MAAYFDEPKAGQIARWMSALAIMYESRSSKRSPGRASRQMPSPPRYYQFALINRRSAMSLPPITRRVLLPRHEKRDRIGSGDFQGLGRIFEPA